MLSEKITTANSEPSLGETFFLRNVCLPIKFLELMADKFEQNLVAWNQSGERKISALRIYDSSQALSASQNAIPLKGIENKVLHFMLLSCGLSFLVEI